jgi:hypothetical protein
MKKQRQRKEIRQNKNGTLVEVTHGPSQEAKERQQLVRLWKQKLGICAARNATAGVALQMFIKETGGTKPWDVDGMPDLPSGSDQWQKKVRELYPNYFRAAHP